MRKQDGQDPGCLGRVLMLLVMVGCIRVFQSVLGVGSRGGGIIRCSGCCLG